MTPEERARQVRIDAADNGLPPHLWPVVEAMALKHLRGAVLDTQAQCAAEVTVQDVDEIDGVTVIYLSNGCRVTPYNPGQS